jgi:poly-gamma-glutamate system protein
MIDIETILRQKGNLRYSSELTTYGCDNDNGEGFYEGGKEAVDAAALRNKVKIWKPSTLNEAIAKRIEIAKHHRIGLLINIGGNHAMIGNCVHASSFPNGLQRSAPTCNHQDRGAIAHISELGIPVIHFLNIQRTGVQYGISDSFLVSESLYVMRTPNNIVASIFLFILVIAIVKIGKLKKE